MKWLPAALSLLTVCTAVCIPLTVWIRREDTPTLFGASGADDKKRCPVGTVPFKPRGESEFATCIDSKIATYIYCVDNILYSTSSYHDGRSYETTSGAFDASSSGRKTFDEQGAVSVTDKGLEARAALALQCGRFVPSDDDVVNAMLEPVTVRITHLKDILRKGSIRRGGIWQWTYPEGTWLVRAHFVEDQDEKCGMPASVAVDAGLVNEDAGAVVGSLCMHADMWYCDSAMGKDAGVCGVRPHDMQWNGRASIDISGNITIENGYLSVFTMKGNLGNGFFRMDMKLTPGPLITGTWYGFGRNDAGEETWSGKGTPGGVFMYAPQE